MKTGALHINSFSNISRTLKNRVDSLIHTHLYSSLGEPLHVLFEIIFHSYFQIVRVLIHCIAQI